MSKDGCIHYLFEAQAKRMPNAIALVLDDKRLTYRELNRQADQLARYLQTCGVGPETLVGLFVNRSMEMVVGVLGILKTGGAYVPLDPQYPSERLQMIRCDTELKVIVTTTELLDEWYHTDDKLELVDICEVIQSAGSQDSQFALPRSTSNQLAYTLYTSGSTGTPKGVMVEHWSVLTLLHGFERVAPSGEKLVGTSVCPFSFDVSAWELFSNLCFGGTLHILRPDRFADPKRFAGYLIDQGVTSTYIPPALLSGVVSELERQGGPVPLNRILVGVEPIKQGVLQRFRDLSERMCIVNGYGPTETTICATFFSFQAAKDPNRRTPIGEAVPGYKVYIVDNDFEPVFQGAAGEILVGGPGLARGYFNRPGLTASQFIPSPFDAEGERLYRTGDLAHYLADGNIEFLGRADHQVKIRGFRIELGEIEATLSRHPAVAKSVILAREDTPGDRRLVAYVVLGQGENLTIDEMRDFLRDKLPVYMVPSFFVLLETLPLTPNGKVDRQALPAPGRARAVREETFVAPRTPLEEMLAGIWAEVLGLESVGVRDNFFELGGHSLLATQVISRVRDAFQIELPLRALFEAPTIADLAERIEAARHTARGLQVLPISSVSPGKELRLSFAQQRLWFLDQLRPDSPVYNVPVVFRLRGLLDVAALEHSLNEIVRRHKALRTTFATVDGRLIQVVAPVLSLTLPVVGLCEVPETEREASARQLLTEEVRRPFDLAHGPLLRATLLRLDAEEHVLLLMMHHIVSDDWSIKVFNQELAVLYEAFSAGKPSPLPELPIQYADFAVWQRQWLQGEVLEEQLSYWKQQLGGSLPVLELPTDRPRPAVQTFEGAIQSFVLSSDLTNALKALSRREGVTLFMTLLAAFRTLLYRYTGQWDILVGSPIANRNRAEIERLIGFFVNTLVLRIDLSGNPTFRELLCRVREVTLEAYAHQDLPFEKLVEELQPERDMSRNPLFQVVFALQNVLVEAPALPGLTVSPVEVHNGTAKFDLTLELWERPEGFCGRLEYDTGLFDATTISRLLGNFQTLLEGIVANPDQCLVDLPVLGEAERRRLLVEWNDTEVEYSRDRCIHELFEAQVERTPDAVAVIFEGQHLTYRELNRRANQLAHYLRELGVGPGVLVGLCVERSLEMVVGILGVLKAGGAYVPLDPAYPRERLAFMLHDAQVVALLTQERLVEHLPPQEVPVLCLDTEWKTISPKSEKNPVSGVRPDDLAYVIYTSGSTGRPKGVTIAHANISPLLHWGYENLGLSTADRVIQYLSYCFDWSVWEIFITLTSGASLFVIPRHKALDPEEALDFIAENGITVLHGTPTQFQALIALEQGLETIEYACIGAEKLPHDLVNRCHDLLDTDCRIFNMYGPTETAIIATILEIDRSDIGKYRDLASVPIGEPISNTRCHILDQRGNLQPIGVPGELHIAGDGLARGYLSRPELTAEKFAPDPFNSRARVYRTGDLVKWLPDGNIEFLGRIDHQVKVRGFRIELGEVEAILDQHPAVQQVVVLVLEDRPGEKRLVAYFVPARGQAPTVGGLRHFLREKLPDYMVPSAFVTLEALPLMPNGKVDRRALPAPGVARSEREGAFVVPRTPVEKELAHTWGDILGIKQVGINDNFFDLGGHSLLATQVISRIRDAFHLEMPIRNLFEAATVADLATVIERKLIEQVDDEKLAQIWVELKQLPKDEVQAMFAASYRKA